MLAADTAETAALSVSQALFERGAGRRGGDADRRRGRRCRVQGRHRARAAGALAATACRPGGRASAHRRLLARLAADDVTACPGSTVRETSPRPASAETAPSATPRPRPTPTSRDQVTSTTRRDLPAARPRRPSTRHGRPHDRRAHRRPRAGHGSSGRHHRGHRPVRRPPRQRRRDQGHRRGEAVPHARARRRLRHRADPGAPGRQRRHGCQLPGGGQLVLADRRYVAMYGHPGTPSLGILGEQPLASVGRTRPEAAPHLRRGLRPAVRAHVRDHHHGRERRSRARTATTPTRSTRPSSSRG